GTGDAAGAASSPCVPADEQGHCVRAGAARGGSGGVSTCNARERRMTRRPPGVRRIALVLVACAARILPPEQVAWGDAMQAELHQVDRDRDALAWGFGCIVAASRQRILAMNIGNLKVSRRVFALEMALCFVPLTFFW